MPFVSWSDFLNNYFDICISCFDFAQPRWPPIIMPAPLPLANDAGLDDIPDALGAYNVCLTLERNATTNENRIHARILGYLILHAPSSIARAEIVGLIHSYSQDENLLELGEHFLLYFICPCESCISSLDENKLVADLLSQNVQWRAHTSDSI